jgi:hypothetical protein
MKLPDITPIPMAPATNGKGSRGLRYMKQDGGGAPVCAGSGDIRPTNSDDPFETLKVKP